VADVSALVWGYELGQYAFAGQYQQTPTPRKGGIFKREYWQFYVVPQGGPEKGKWTEFDFVIVSAGSEVPDQVHRAEPGRIPPPPADAGIALELPLKALGSRE
jgi:hypothetical protein